MINASCAAALNEWCNNLTANAACIHDLAKTFPDYAPLYGLWAPECGSFVGTGANETCGASPPKPAAWRCYSHLAVDAEHKKWDGVHPTGCTRPELARVFDECMGVPTPPPPPPLPPPLPGPKFTGPVHE